MVISTLLWQTSFLLWQVSMCVGASRSLNKWLTWYQQILLDEKRVTLTTIPFSCDSSKACWDGGGGNGAGLGPSWAWRQQKSAFKMLQLLGCFRADRLTWPVESSEKDANYVKVHVLSNGLHKQLTSLQNTLWCKPKGNIQWCFIIHSKAPFTRDAKSCIWNLFLMRLPQPLLLLLLLEMAGTCYIIAEGGKTHTSQQYLQQKIQTENIPALLNSETFQESLAGWRSKPELPNSQTDGHAVSRTRSHISVLCAGLWSVAVTIGVPAPQRSCEVKESEKNILEGTQLCKSPLVCYVWGLVSRI